MLCEVAEVGYRQRGLAVANAPRGCGGGEDAKSGVHTRQRPWDAVKSRQWRGTQGGGHGREQPAG